jgi:putative intracellular protease/amidase
MKILIVLTSHDQFGDTGKKTGFWLEEFAAPYYVLRDAGAAITLASAKGGQPPLDPISDLPENQTELTKRFRTDTAAQAELANTKKLADVSADDFDAVFYPGGHGPMWDMPNNATSIALIEAFVKADKPVGAVCHAPVALVNVRGKDGEYLVKGKRITGFTKTEEAVGLTAVVLPRRVTRRVRLTRLFPRATWYPWSTLVHRISSGKHQENLLGFYGPLSLLVLLSLWAFMLIFGFGLLFYASGAAINTAGTSPGFATCLYLSGTTSSL